jgi:hypothetical protein
VDRADWSAATVRKASRIDCRVTSRYANVNECFTDRRDIGEGHRELLGQAGYGILTASNLPDALVLLQAARSKLVTIGSGCAPRAARSPRKNSTDWPTPRR